jgi:hypothetical protein
MVLSFVLGLLATAVYGSFLEWFVHRYGMHTQKLSKWAFKRHAIQHHSMRRSLKTFYVPDFYRIWDSSAVPLLWLAHVPLYLAAGYFFNIWAAIGTATGAMLYTVGYEVLHFFIHAPRGYWFQRTRLFHFYCEYHRVHHHRARWNYNVVCPLADMVLGTFSLDPLPPEPSTPAGTPTYTGPRSVFARRSVAAAAGQETDSAGGEV